MAEAIPVAAIGVGHLGKHHARLLGELPEARLGWVVDADPDVGKAIAEKVGAAYCASVDELPDEVVAASIATPTQAHHAVAGTLLKRGVHCLVEKPLASTLDEARDLVRLARDGNRVLQVGHIERFNPAMVAARSRLRNPRFMEVRRVAPFSFRSQDISVVLDLMIHDIDLILDLARSPVAEVAATGVPILTSSEDIANARIVFESGCVADVTASRVALKAERKLRVFQEDSYLSIDLMEKSVRFYEKHERLARGEVDVTDLDVSSLGGNPLEYILTNLIRCENLEVVQTNALQEELRQFLACVREGKDPDVTGEDGLQAMEVAERVHAAVRGAATAAKS